MTTLNKIVYAVKEKIGGGKVTDDETPFKRRVAFIASNIRAYLLDEELKKGRLDSQWMQTLYCVPLQQSSFTECCEDAVPNCKVIRTEEKMPEIASDPIGPVIMIESTNGQIAFSLSRDFRSKYRKHTKYEKLVEQAYFRNQYLYFITENDLLNKVNVTAVFTNPEEAGKFKNCDDQPCWSWDSNYPIPERLVEKLIDSVVQVIIGEKALQQDKINDGSEDNKANTR